MNKFWMIYRTTGNNRHPPNYKHTTFESAQKEAHRLAVLFPGKFFAILETVGGAYVEPKKRVDTQELVS